MKKILVPIDFSECSDNAIDFALQSKKLFPADIVLLHAFELKGNIYTDHFGLNMEFKQSLLDDIHDRLSLIKKSILEAEGIEVKTEIITEPLNVAIQKAIATHNIDLLIMGTLGASGFKEKLMGTKTSQVISYTSVPVLIIPADYSWENPEKILLTTNHFEKETFILDFLFKLADLYKARIHVAVFSDQDTDDVATQLKHERNAAQYELMLRKKYSAPELTVTHLYGKDFEDSLQSHIDKNGISILVMIPYKKGLPGRLFHPSMTKRMSFHTTIPLLVIPSPGDYFPEPW